MDALQPQKARGMTLLYQHCSALTSLEDAQEPASERLEGMIGGELTRFLLSALVRRDGARASA
jgi:hypothetical protein